jgi:hypothetical protein
MTRPSVAPHRRGEIEVNPGADDLPTPKVAGSSPVAPASRCASTRANFRLFLGGCLVQTTSD